MEQKVKIIACRTLKHEIEMFKPPEVDAVYLESGYHRLPKQLREMIQSYIDEEKEAEVIIFGFGLCSNGLAGLYSNDKTLIIPKVHDCIGVLLGSREAYNKEFRAHPGTYYLSKGWIDELRDPYAEYLDYVKQYGEEMAQWLIDMQYHNYTRVAFIYDYLPEQEKYEDYSRKVAEFLGVKFEKIQGKSDFFEKLISGDWDSNNFVITPPGQTVKSKDFFY